ncbi:MAG: 4Fe-4S binding protein [Sinobacteraceae bacterium]|nr:4Fe-4S binding protein [Nevskiaceae bacterium]
MRSASTAGITCHACGLCVKACPEHAITLVRVPSENDGGGP